MGLTTRRRNALTRAHGGNAGKPTKPTDLTPARPTPATSTQLQKRMVKR